MSAVEVAGLALVALVLGVAALGFVVIVREERGIRRIAPVLAGRLGGTCSPGSWLRFPRVAFPLRGLRAEVEWFSDSESPAMRVVVNLEGQGPGVLTIGDGPGAEAERLRVGHAEFDAQYFIHADPADFAARVFSAERKERLVASVLRTRPYSIVLSPSSLEIRAARSHEPERCLALVKTAEELLGFVLESR
jgi:hypothetical protein